MWLLLPLQCNSSGASCASANTGENIYAMATKTRKITDADRRAAQKLRAIWERRQAEYRAFGTQRLTQEEAGAEMDIGQSAVGQYLRGDIPLGLQALLKFAALLQVDPREIRDDFKELNIIMENGKSKGKVIQDNVRQVPLLQPENVNHFLRDKMESQSNIRERIGLDSSLELSRDGFAVEVTERGLVPELYPGDIVIVDPAVPPVPGDLVIAHVDGQDHVIIRKYRPRNAQVVELSPINEDYPSDIISDDSPGSILGTVVQTRRNRRG